MINEFNDDLKYLASTMGSISVLAVLACFIVLPKRQNFCLHFSFCFCFFVFIKIFL